MRIYRNLRDNCWSVMHRGRVAAHTPSITIHNATLVVREAGRQRVIREKRKNVHAFVDGDYNGIAKQNVSCGWTRLSYNPYRASHFVVRDTGEAVFNAEYVYLSGAGEIWASGLNVLNSLLMDGKPQTVNSLS